MRPGYLCLLRHRQTAAITNNSLAGAADYARWLKLPTDRFEVIHNGFEFPALSLTASSIAVRDSLGIPHDALVLGAIMRFSEEKCPYLWIQAAERVVRQVPQVRCVIFGSGVLHDDIRRTVLNLGLGDRILLPGITRDAWASLACMDVFMLTSRMEGLPNVLIEAQSVGVPVVTTGQGGMRETYSEGVTGWTASSPTPDALAAATVPLLLDGAKRTRASQAAREFVRTRFNAMKMIEATSRLFDRTIHHDHTTTHLPLRQPTDP
jgi:glycosyltransferase involved in cell wall biosynthesis